MVRKQKRWITFFLFAIAIIAVPLLIWRPFQSKRLFLHIPIIVSHGQPCVRGSVEGKSYLFHLDSGASDCFSMNREMLQTIKHKTLMGTKTWRDVNGNEYTTPRYIVQEIDINTLQISNATVIEESVDFLFKGSKLTPFTQSNEEIKRELADIAGRLGPKTLRVLNYWLIDLPNSTLIAIRDIEKIKDIPGLTLDGFTEVPLEKITPHIVISVDTDIGTKKLALDTGAFRSVLTPPSEEYTNHEMLKINQLTIGQKSFGEIVFYLFQLPADFAFDGLLGRDFLQNHAVYLDFKQNRAFIK